MGGKQREKWYIPFSDQIWLKLIVNCQIIICNLFLQDLENNAEVTFCEKSNPKLYPGEIIITKGQRVLLFPHVAERSKGLAGNLYVTNFRLIFAAYEEDSTLEVCFNKLMYLYVDLCNWCWFVYILFQDECLHQRNLFFGEHSVCLTNIESIHQVSRDKKRKLFPDSTLTGKVKGLQVWCKNMKVLTFNFDQSPIDQGKSVTNTLLHHAFPGRHQLLFAYEYK